MILFCGVWVFILCLLVQMFPVAVTCGNTFVLKPSEKDPGKTAQTFYPYSLELFSVTQGPSCDV